MNPHLLLQAMGFSLILLSSPMAEASADDDDDDPKMATCEPARCGNVTDIHYPFWLNGSNQSSYCGFPQFEIHCENDSPILYMSYNHQYIIKKIFYNNQSLMISNLHFLDDKDCPFKLHNVIFNLTPFSINPANTYLFFFHNCSILLPYSHKVSCDSSGLLAYLGEHVGSSSYCQEIVVPAIGFPGASGRDYIELLRNGFLVDWTTADCSECRGSEGQCGYNRKKDRFMCICSDGAQDISCRKDNGKLIAIGVSVGVASLILACVLCFFCWRRKKRRTSTSSNFLVVRNVSSDPSSLKDPEFGSMNYHTHLFSYEELQEATNGFDEARELGDGGFGTVYKGKLRDGRIVAVKRLYENNYKRVEQFMNEIEILSHLHHENLVTLYGCTSRHSCELLLVYEFVSNGTVADHLHGSSASLGALTWPVRLSIAIETACALAYLHAVEPQIIHRDVKTNNILLDDSFHVKVADFGLSRLFPVNASHVSTLPQGTPGYVDPEYHQCYQLTDKSDVYSFGVVLVELISSKPAVDISRHRHEINLANMAINRIQSCKLEELIDPGLGHRMDKETERMITMVAELAFRCLQGDKDMRPCIKEVLVGLERIRDASDNTAESNELTREESQLLKNLSPFSPDSVTVRWDSSLTTPNASE